MGNSPSSNPQTTAIGAATSIASPAEASVYPMSDRKGDAVSSSPSRATIVVAGGR